jgi:DNA (cytosine-5)-methyltransferase 1
MARIAEGIKRYVIEAEKPFLLNLTHGGRLEPLDEPFRTITAAHRGEKALVVPYGIQTRNGERKGQTPRTLDLQKPMNTITAQGSQGALVAAFLSKYYGGVIGHGLERPVGTVTAKDHHALVATHLTKFYGTSKAGADIQDPMPTVTASSGGGHMGLVTAFLMKYYGTGGQLQSLSEPMHTIVSKARFGLVTVNIGGEEYAVTDIGMRMLQPRELARAQGFSDEYKLTGTKTSQIARIGNSVPPPVVKAIVAAQFNNNAWPSEVSYAAA